MIGGRRPLKGRKPADRRVRVERPHSAFFRYAGPGQLVAKPAAHQPEDRRSGGRAPGSGASLLGRPLASEEEIGERLSKKKALAIFSSDAISSSAYATEEILRVLIRRRDRRGAASTRRRSRWRSRCCSRVVAISYRQVCRAYPSGGGAYSVVEGEPRRDGQR